MSSVSPRIFRRPRSTRVPVMSRHLPEQRCGVHYAEPPASQHGVTPVLRIHPTDLRRHPTKVSPIVYPEPTSDSRYLHAESRRHTVSPGPPCSRLRSLRGPTTDHYTAGRTPQRAAQLTSARYGYDVARVWTNPVPRRSMKPHRCTTREDASPELLQRLVYTAPTVFTAAVDLRVV